MKRKIISALLALILCFSLAISVSAADTGFIVDEFGYLTDEEVSSLNMQASAIYDQTGVGIFFVFSQTDDVETFDVSAIVGEIPDYVVMLENETHWYMHLGGRGEIITLEDEDVLRAIYDEAETYIEGIMDFLEATAAYFPEIPTATEPVIYAEECFLYDDADLLTDTEEETLVAQLEKISHTYNTQLVIAALPSLGGSDIDDYVEYLYDSMGFGYGETKEGVLLLICMNPREYRIMSNGYAGVAIGPDQVDTLCDFMDMYLPNGYYVAAFNSFVDQCGEMLAYYEAGSPFQVGKNLAISLVIGLVVGLIVVFILKGKLKSVRKQHSAHVYVKQGSMHLSLQHDIFLYRNVTRTERQKREESTSSSSFSSSGSNGTARTKGGGSF